MRGNLSHLFREDKVGYCWWGNINLNLSHLIYLAAIRVLERIMFSGLYAFIQPNKGPEMLLNLFKYARKCIIHSKLAG